MKENKHSVEVICSIMEAWPCFSDIQRLQLTLVCTALLSFPAKYSNHHIFAENAGHGAVCSVGRKRRLAGGGDEIGVKDFSAMHSRIALCALAVILGLAELSISSRAVLPACHVVLLKESSVCAGREG